MNKSTSFQPVGGVVLSGKLPRRFPPFLAVWGGQTEREAPFLNVKLHTARFRVCVRLAALLRVLSGIGGKPLLPFCIPCYAVGVFFGCFPRLLTRGKRRF